MTRVPSKHSKVQKQTTGMSQVVASHADVQGRWGHWCGQEVFSILCVVPVGKVVVSGRLQKTNLPEQRQTEEVKMPEAWNHRPASWEANFCRRGCVFRGPLWAALTVPLLRGPRKVIIRPGWSYKTAKRPYVPVVCLGQCTTECPHTHMADWQVHPETAQLLSTAVPLHAFYGESLNHTQL